MLVVFLQILGGIVFVIGTVFYGKLVRQDRTKSTAEKLSRKVHFLFWSCLALPGGIILIYPGLTKLIAFLV